ncbi:MAG TPA: quinone oxidoreductase [Kofleriaceae bacterium]|jgi:NADPH2:quinone reductase|nr:quinone oxidoreductase [Kofleriaceae bacterium]
MRAIQIERTGGPEVLQLVDVPARDPGPGEVRVRHSAVGINFIDTYNRTGLYKATLPLILGAEGAGTVEAVGSAVTHLTVGDRVAYAAKSQGSYAETRTIDAMLVCKLPDAIDFETAAAMMLKGMTVQYLLRRTRAFDALEKGDAIVWHAGAGGVGLIACQWAAALGYQVIATAGSDEKCALAKAHGAAHAINYRTENVVERVRALTGGRGVKVVYDSVGKDTWDISIDCLRPLGLLVSFGNASGAVPPFSVLQLSAKGSLYVNRPTLNTHMMSREVVQEMADDLFAVAASGAVKIQIGQRYKLEDAAKAHIDLEARHTTGSSILTL